MSKLNVIWYGKWYNIIIYVLQKDFKEYICYGRQVDREQDRITILLISNLFVEIFSKIDCSIEISVEYGYIYDIRNWEY